MKQISVWQSRFTRASKTELALSKRISRVLHARRIDADLLCRLFDQQLAALKALGEAQDRIHECRLAEFVRAIFQKSPLNKPKTTT